MLGDRLSLIIGFGILKHEQYWASRNRSGGLNWLLLQHFERSKTRGRQTMPNFNFYEFSLGSTCRRRWPKIPKLQTGYGAHIELISPSTP